MIKVAIVEDNTDIRNGLAMLINYSEGFCCEYLYANAEDALVQIPQNQVDVVIMDIHLPQMSGIECVSKLKPHCPKTQFMMFTVYEDDNFIFEAIKAGATGYILKKTPPAKLLEALQDIYQGGSPMSGQIARKVLLTFQPKPNPYKEQLSEREKEIVEMLAKGLRYKEIADKMFISVETVRTHIRNIYEKLQVNSRTEALNKWFGKE